MCLLKQQGVIDINYKVYIERIASVSRFEIKRSLFDRKLLLALAVIILIMGISLIKVDFVISSAFGDRDYIGRLIRAATMGISFSSIIFASDSLVSEFETGSGLVLFTKPVSRNQGFIGKFISAYLCTFMMSIICYAIIITAASYKLGYVSENLWISFLLTMLYIFAAVGVCMLFSSISNKGLVSIAAGLLVFFVLGMVIVESAREFGEPWYSLYYSVDAISNAVEEHSSAFVSVPDLTTSAAVMTMYGAFSSVFAAIIFNIRRQP